MGGTHGVAVWVDLNQSSSFEAAERLYNTTGYQSTPHSGSFTIPANTPAGTYRMRVQLDGLVANPANPCQNNSGNIIDYALVVSAMGSLSGTVTDENGGVAGVEISITSLGEAFTATTVAGGAYTFPYVPVGPQTVRAYKLEYFEAFEEITIEEDVETILNFQLTMRPHYPVSGVVQCADGSPVSNAHVTLTGIASYSTSTNATGGFSIPDALAASDYILTIVATGYVTHTDTIDVLEETNLGVIILYSTATPPTNVAAAIADEYVDVTWTAVSVTGCLAGYYVYRLRPGQELTENQWFFLNENNPASCCTFTDNTWPTAGAGSWRWAVKAVYHGDILSEPVFSDPLEKVTEGSYTINVTTNSSATNSVGAVVKLTGEGSNFTPQTVGTSGSVTFSNVPFGTYRVDITLTGFHDYTSIVNVMQGSPAHNAVLIEALYSPHQLNLAVSPCEALFTWSMFAPFYDDMESHANFIINNIGDYTLIRSGSAVPRVPPGTTFQNSTQPQSFIVMNPSATTPPATAANWAPYSGSKYLACFNKYENDYTGGINNDWLILPKLRIVEGTVFKFRAKSFSDQYNLDRFKVGVSTTGADPESFTFISAGTYVQVPTTWTEYSYNLSAYAGQEIRLAINCVSNDSWFLMIDDISVDAPGAANSRQPVSYSIYLNDNLHTSGILETSFLFNKNNTDPGSYSRVGVRAHYETGTSDIVTLNQPFEICNSITNNEVNYGIYPNPATNSLTIERAASTQAVVELYNAMGMRIGQYETGDMKFDLNVASLASGTYFVRVIEGDKAGVKSFVKK
jgi:hypothetical protein